MDTIHVLVNRYGGDMVEADFGDRESVRALLGEKMRASLHDMAEDAISGEVHYDKEKGTGSVRYVRDRRFEPAVLHSDKYEIVEVQMPGFHSEKMLILGTEEMIAEAVLFCPDNIRPMEFVREKAKELGQRITATGIGWARVLDADGKEHLWSFISI